MQVVQVQGVFGHVDGTAARPIDPRLRIDAYAVADSAAVTVTRRSYLFYWWSTASPSIIVCRLLSVLIDTVVCMPRTIWVQRANYILLAAFVVCDDKNKLT
jgi:hypothetical protein